MVNYISHNGYSVEKCTLTEDEINSLRKELTVTPKKMEFAMKKTKEKEVVTYELYREDENNIYIPIYFGLKKFGKAKNTMKINKIKIKFTGKLRDYQEPIVEKCITKIKAKGGGLLSVPCGDGKTSMALYIASVLGLKTLVVVHKDFLLKQWIDRISDFTTATCGRIQGKIIDVEGKDIVIATIQSLSQKDYDKEIFKQFSFIVYDEAHHCPSRVFSRALLKTVGIHTLALSATPYRGDSMIKIMHWFLGETLYRIKFKLNPYVEVKCFHYFSTDRLFVEKKAYIQGATRPFVTKMINNLCELKARTRTIANIIDYLRRDPERKILIMSERKPLLKDLKEMVDRRIQESVDKKEINAEDIKTYYYIGDMNDEEREEAEKNADILFGTYQLAKSGLDIPKLNTIILATSMKDVVQSEGRIMRKVLQTGDIPPLIIDFSDHLSSFINHTKNRKKFYKTCKYNIKDYYIYERTCVSEDSFNQVLRKREKDEKEIKEIEELKLKDLLHTNKIVVDETLKREDLIILEDDETDEEDEEEEEEKPKKNLKMAFKKRIV